MHPYEWGILGARGSRAGWLSDERFPRACSTSAGCFACKQDSGRAKALGVHRRCRTAPTGLRRARQCSRKGGCAVHQLAHSWLQERLAGAQFYPCPNCPIKLSCLGFQSERERNSYLPTIPIAVLQKPLICKKCSNSTLVRTFDMACYATSVLIRRIQEVSEYKKSIKKQLELI
jgi:hypothetical protein